MKKTLIYQVNDYRKIDNMLSKIGYIDLMIEGVLVDSFYLDLPDHYKYKHLIILEKYLNPWSSGQQIIFTNDEKLASDYYQFFQDNQEDEQ